MVEARLTNQSMWQAESEATKSCSGSAPFACGAPGGIFSFAAFPSSRTVGSNSMRWARLYVPSSNGIPFLCHSVVARWMDIGISLHSKNAEPGFLDRRVEGRRDRKREGAARFLGGDHSIVPKPRGGVVGMPLPLVLVADGTLELLLLRFAPGAALRLDAVALHRGEDGSRLRYGHHRDAGVRPHPKEARSESAPAHPVVARAERAADDDGEFRHPAACDRGHHLGAVLGDPGRLVLFSHHEACDVLEKNQRNPALAGELDEVRTFQRRFGKQDSVVRDDADRVAPDAREPGHQSGAVLRLELVELACVDDARNHLADVVGLALVFGDDPVQF